MARPVNNVVPFPFQVTCFHCAHYTESYCRLFDEPIESEIEAAKDCNGFEVAP